MTDRDYIRPVAGTDIDPETAPAYGVAPASIAPTTTQLELGYVRTINIAMSILSLRILAMIALVGAVVMFGYAVMDPVPWRLYSAVSFACVVLWPVVWLYLKLREF